MKQLWLYLLILFVTASCTYTPSPEGGDVDISMPLTSKDWVAHHYSDENTEYCVIKSSYNGIKVILKKDIGRTKIEYSVKGTRRMHPGTRFHIRVNGNTYRTLSTFFPKTLVEPLIHDLQQTDKAYLEWRRQTSDDSGGNEHFTNILYLKEFPAHYNNCTRTLL